MTRQFRNGGPGTGKFAFSILSPFIRKSWYFWVDTSKWEQEVGDMFSQLLRNKMAHVDHRNAVLSGQQKQQNVPAGYVINWGWGCFLACLQALTGGFIAENPFRSLTGRHLGFWGARYRPPRSSASRIIQNGGQEKRTPSFLAEEKLRLVCR